MESGCMTTTGLLISTVLLTLHVGSCAHQHASTQANSHIHSTAHAEGSANSLQTPGLLNLNEITPGVFIGGAPETPQHFEALAALGIRAVLAVDAAAPDLASLRDHRIRSVHIPIEYSGVSPEQQRSLTKAMATLPRPIYVHCHHGKHRGPAAACIALLGTGEMDHAQAEQVLKDAGTSPNYPGLFEAVRAAAPIAEPGKLDVQLVEVAPVAPFAQAMTEIELAMERLELVESNGWEVPETHPDLAPVTLAAQIETGLRALSLLPREEISVHSQSQADPDSFILALADAAKHASLLESAIAKNDWPSAIRMKNRLKSSCISCHTVYRNRR